MYRPNPSSKRMHLTKGGRQLLAQNRKAAQRKKALNKSPEELTAVVRAKAQVQKLWKKYGRAFLLSAFFRSKHKPHQGEQEKARRVRQMKEKRCINPETWLYYYGNGEWRQR